MTDEELRDLQERVQVVNDMSETQGWMLLVDAARSVLLQKQMRIVQGKCENHEEYKTECAFGDGVEFLITLPARLQLQLDRELELRTEAESLEV